MFCDNRSDYFWEGKSPIYDPWGRPIRRGFSGQPAFEEPPSQATAEQKASYKVLLAQLNEQRRSKMRFMFF